MRIGMVCYPTVGGSGVVATELGHALAAAGHQVYFISYEVPFRLRLDEPNIHFYEVSINSYELFQYPDYALALAVKMAEVSKECQLDILHVHYAIPHATSAFLAKQLLGASAPAVVTTLHGTDITLVGRDPAYFEIVKFSIEHSDGVTSVSENLRKQIYDSFGIQKEIQKIYNFFVPKPELIGQKPLRSSFVEEGEKLLVHSSNFRSVKRVEDVVQIFCKVREKIPAKLLFVGSGEAIQDVKNMVCELKLQKEVHFLGKIPVVDPYVASGDLFLLPSSQESFGLAALEAMAYGVPSIATRVGGLPEVIVEGKTGFLFEVGDVDGMAEKAIHLLNDSKLYNEMSKACIQHAKDKFCMSKILPQYESYYESVLSNKVD